MVYFNARRWHYLRRRKSGQPIRFRLPRGMTISLYPEGQIAELLYAARFERTELALVKAYLKPGMNVIDVGANVGLYSILAHRAIKPGGRVWAFEPSSETYPWLIKNLSLNDAASVIPLKLALADAHGGHLILKRDPGSRDGERYISAGNDLHSPAFNSPVDVGDIETVPVTALDDYIFNQPGEPPRIDFIKMDVEGGEYDVFRGACRVLASNANLLLLFECTPEGCRRAGHTQDEVFDFLKAMGFELYCWDRPNKRWESRHELLLAAGNIWACHDKNILPRLA